MSSTRLTIEMRSALSLRLGDVENRISDLRREAGVDDSVESTALLLELMRERDQLADALADAVPIESTPFDSYAIEIGDAVTIRSQQGVIERYVLVDIGPGPRVQDDWVSVSSPLGRALLGRPQGDEIQVSTPSGVATYLILAFERSGAGTPVA
jgi:transcription elongation GreA/GreB family factor